MVRPVAILFEMHDTGSHFQGHHSSIGSKADVTGIEDIAPAYAELDQAHRDVSETEFVPAGNDQVTAVGR